MDTAMITERDILILRLLYTYYLLNRPQVQRLVFPNDPHGRVTRRRLQMLVAENLICRLRTFFCHPMRPPARSTISRKGCELLAEHFEDDRYLATNTAPLIPHHVFHWLAVVDTHILLDQAVASQTSVKVEGWINEWDIVNKDESAPEKRFNLYTLIRENPRLACAPDSGLSAVGVRSQQDFLLGAGSSERQAFNKSPTERHPATPRCSSEIFNSVTFRRPSPDSPCS